MVKDDASSTPNFARLHVPHTPFKRNLPSFHTGRHHRNLCTTMGFACVAEIFSVSLLMKQNVCFTVPVLQNPFSFIPLQMQYFTFYSAKERRPCSLLHWKTSYPEAEFPTIFTIGISKTLWTSHYYLTHTSQLLLLPPPCCFPGYKLSSRTAVCRLAIIAQFHSLHCSAD